MNYQITNISTYINELLASDAAGIVHSVYNRTINLMINGQLLSLQAAGTPFSPITLLTDISEDSFQKLPVVSGMPVTVDHEKIFVERKGTGNDPICFDYRDSQILSCTFQPSLSGSELCCLRRMTENVIHSSDTNGFADIFRENPTSDPPFFLNYAKTVILQARKLILSKETDAAARTLTKLIGLGTGLTPCGDDFLCGILAGLIMVKEFAPYYSKFENALKNAIEENLTNTNDISRSFLLCAIRGQFSQAVLHLAESGKTDSSDGSTAPGQWDEKTSQLFQSFHAIGHSSGIDTLCGIFFILELPLLAYLTPDNGIKE